MPHPKDTAADDSARARDLAHQLGFLTDEDLALLAGVKLSTTEAWRKRGMGPAYALIGTRYLYPREAVSAFLSANVRERSTPCLKGLL